MKCPDASRRTRPRRSSGLDARRRVPSDARNPIQGQGCQSIFHRHRLPLTCRALSDDPPSPSNTGADYMRLMTFGRSLFLTVLAQLNDLRLADATI